MAYNDEEGKRADGRVIKDDLDLHLIAPDGTIYYAWQHKANLVAEESPIEKMVIKTPQTGSWTIRVFFYDSVAFSDPFVNAEQRFGVHAVAILKTPSLSLSVPQQSFQVSPGQTFAIQPTITNSGGYIAAGVTVKVEGSSSFGGDINTTKYLRNLMFQGDSVIPTISFTAPSVPSNYVLIIKVDGINKEFDNASYPISIPITVDVTQSSNGTDTIALHNPAASTFSLRNSNSTGVANLAFSYGPAAGWIPLVGDWDGDGVGTICLYNPATSTFFLRNSNSTGVADVSFAYGPAGAGWIPLVGDWDGDGVDTIGLYNPTTSTFFLRNSNSSGVADLSFAFGPAGAGWIPIVGDWNGNGIDTIGLYNPTTGAFFLRNTNSTGIADVSFGYGPAGAGWKPLVGDWNGDGVDAIGLYDPGASAFFLRNTNSTGVADVSFAYGPAGAGWIPLVGDWDGL